MNNSCCYRLIRYIFAVTGGNIFYPALLAICIMPLLSGANNVMIDGVTLIDNTHLKFTISWENSWNLENVKEPYNHDAVWLFVKFKKDNGVWEHLRISSCPNSGHYTTNVAQDRAGVFLIRGSKGAGNNVLDSLILTLDQALSDGDYEFRVFGIEMVWITTSPFYIGDGWSQKCFSRGDTLAPFPVRSEAALNIGKDSLSLRDTGNYDPKSSIPAIFPKGYLGFYSMKYEISQEEYADFLNCLSYTQQQNHTISSPGASKGTGAFVAGLSNRNGIIISEPGNAPAGPAIFACNADNNTAFNAGDDGGKRACNFLNWGDVAAYLDWAALRPMTELEFEKICRGPLRAIPGEFCWGTAASVDANTIQFDGSDSEEVTDNIPAGAGIASYGYLGPQGPLRAGFAARNTTDRLHAGSSYYGVMEMSGNLWELCIIVNTAGLQYDGQNGDGMLDDAGNANTLNWPGIDGNGAGYRGGAWLSGVIGDFRDPAVSARFYAELKPDLRRNTGGGRGVR